MNPTQLIDKQIADLSGWRGQTFNRLRTLIHAADPELSEEWKWNTAVWAKHGLVCAVNAFKDHVKVNFFQGAALPDPHGLLNSGLEGKVARSIDIFEGGQIDEPAFKELVQAAVRLNKPK